jgi:elongin-A
MDEQQARLEKLTKKVKHHQEISIPVKTTKLAYVDSAVKPPRGVASKQRQYGTEHVKVVSPAARVAASLSGIGTNVAKAGDFRLKVSTGVRDHAQAGKL